jgi:hypothetical protein
MKIPNYYGVKSLDDIDPREAFYKDLVVLGANKVKAHIFALDAGSSQWMSYDEIISNKAIKDYVGSKVNPIKVRKAFIRVFNPISDMYMASEFGEEFSNFIKAEDKKARKKGWK